MDYNKRQKEYETILKRIEKSKEEQNENNIKLKELNDWKEKLEKIAYEMYGIEEYKDTGGVAHQVGINHKALKHQINHQCYQYVGRIFSEE